MSQQTNLNVSPYFDDFDANNDYHRVLFKPGYPVQARELTTLQSILQNQIEKFGQHFFKEGAKVIPGNTGYNALYYAVELTNTYLGIPVAAYASQLIGTKITGQTSGVSAVVDKVLFPQDSERGNLTLYVAYLSSSTQNNSTQQFSDGESLVSNTTITSGLLGNTSIAVGTPFAITISNNATSVGSCFNISEGIYFIRGQLVNVNTETLILDQYTNKPNYRVGLFINEEIVNSDIDETLNDNSQGFNNYASPGADRLKITTLLFKKSLNDFDDGNFVELATVKDGILRSKKETTEYSLIADELARRTYSESGDYVTDPFQISVKESLNNLQGNQGIFNQGQFTYGGSTPSDDLIIYQISPGKAFVRGYEVETISPTFLDASKPRTTKTLENQSINYNTGPTFTLNRVYGSPTIGVGNTYILSLRDQRVGSSSLTASGKEIGVARVYDFRLESGSYNSTNLNLNQWNISLYDIQTITEITLNEPITLPIPTFIKGKSSGATGFLKDSVSAGVALTVYDKSGDFIRNESFTFNGIDSGFVAIAVTSYGVSDIKSVYGIVGSGSTFTADTLQVDAFNVGIATISATGGGISTVVSPNISFPGNIVKVGNLIKYSDSTSADPIIARVSEVGISSIKIVGVTGVSGISSGKLPSSALSVTDFKVLKTNLESSTDNTLYTRLPKNNISNVSLADATLSIRKTFIVNISGNQLSVPVSAGTNETFLPFDEERYSLIRSDGSIEVLTSGKFSFIPGGTQLQIYNLGTDNTDATLIATLRKTKPKAKVKLKNRVNALIIDKSKNRGSGIGGTTLNDGLTFGNYAYGTRVQDEIISLNTPDIIKIYGIYESADTSNPSAPKVTLSSISGKTSTTSDLVIGEQIIGKSSGAVAICAERLTASQISFAYINQNTFKEGESLSFSESGLSAVITALDSPSFNISQNYTFKSGQKGTFYDYGSISRKSGFAEPSKKLKIYFESGYYASTDDGDITTVNSYDSYDYGSEINSVNGIRNSNIIDIRPRVSSYTISEGARSPFEFYGRVFNASGNSATNILASDESILVSFSFYLGRIDRIYLTKDGNFQIKYGTPSESPQKPVSVDNALEITTISLPPYLYDVSHASIEFLEHKRYRMVDIKQLENRIRSLEYYTTLSLLETDTANLFVPDADRINRFKSGFFVDNFSSTLAQETDILLKNSIDLTNKALRPSHYTTSIDLMPGPIVNADPTADLKFSPIEGINIRKTGDIVTLDYAEVEWLKQTFATTSTNVTPFMISFWNGTLELTPESDTWVDTVRLEAKIINTEGNYAETLANAVNTQGVDPQTGLAPTKWDAPVDNWTGREVITSAQKRSSVKGARENTGNRLGDGPGYVVYAYGTQTTTVYEDTIQEVKQTGTQTTTGTQLTITEQFDKTSVEDRVVSRDLVPYMRSRNIQFVCKQIKPLTRLYAFFDGVNVTKYCVPKLLEINMISGTFEVGEKVTGVVTKTGLGPNSNTNIPAKITFRVAQSNHKEGPYGGPTSIYPQNPYTNQILSASYSSTSTILNVDTFSLSNEPQGEYSGWVESDMILVGGSSKAQAKITNVRLMSDLSATLIGSFYLPNPNTNVHPRFEAGKKILTIINNELNDQNVATTIGEEEFISSGTLETVQENIISVRNARIQNKQVFQEKAISKTTGAQVVATKIISQTSKQVIIGYYDPLAQSFFVDDSTGVFLTSCDIFFRSKDDMDIPVTFQLRTMQNGSPTGNILPFSEIVLEPSEITTSANGSAATNIKFKAPVYLEGGKEYCMCLASISTKYTVYISRVGGDGRTEVNDLITQTYISNQPYLGSLFKSQNASTWEASQWEDLKFTLYRADFLTSGTVEFYSPELTEGNRQIAKLLPDSLSLNSKKVRIGIGSTLNDSGLTIGNTVLQRGTNATGNYVGSAGIATGQLRVINAGIGYTGNMTFTGVSLETITGNGTGATADITISNGSVVSTGATILTSGNGYQVGDVLGISTIGLFNTGVNARLSIVSIASTNQLILDNVQGNFIPSVGVANSVQYVNNSGITTYLNSSSGGNVQITNITTVNDGLHIKVNHKNHGMYSSNNYVILSNVQSDINPTKLSIAYNADSVGPISVDNSSNFGTFENVGVGTTNQGYLLIGSEIIKYTSVSSGIIGGDIVRGANPLTYPVGTPVYKYELNGISLNRINTTHYLGDATVSDAITFDSYNIKLDTSSSGIDRSSGISFPSLYQNQTKSSGGSNIQATQNIPFEIIIPMVHNVTVQGTSLTGEVRTTTGASISGNEIPFTNNGFESITINSQNYFNTPRLIASKVNEDSSLINVPGNKSMNLRLVLGTVDTKLSPVIDTQRISTILTSNRVNSVITDYANDSRVNGIDSDPTAFQYISKEITLENSATSIKLLLNAHINLYSDIRAFYSISQNPNFEAIFTPFPGYLNLDYRGQVINDENNDGRPDKFITPSSTLGFMPSQVDFSEYSFTADQLPPFRSFRIKIVSTSTNQVYVPIFKDLRAIALA